MSRAAAAELPEDLRPLDEERALLLVEGLEGREVDDGRIHFDLPEVGIDGGVERQAAAHAPLEVQAGAGECPRTVVERIARVGRRNELAARHGVGQQLEVVGLRDAVESTRCAIRHASPLSFFGTMTSHGYSFFRWTKRSTCAPRLVLRRLVSQLGYGMRISTDQPFPSTATADAHTPSHDGSSLVS